MIAFLDYQTYYQVRDYYTLPVTASSLFVQFVLDDDFTDVRICFVCFDWYAGTSGGMLRKLQEIDGDHLKCVMECKYYLQGKIRRH